MQECIFCKIINREIPADIVYEDDCILAFKDIQPAAPTHLLFIPKKHIPTFFDLQPEDSHILGKLQLAAASVAKDMGLTERGFRLVSNCMKDAGQLVWHIHYHFLAGRTLQWPPG
ncbi:histidine triad nucleotide-binding protein [Desulfallas thermosapovorans]|uniref:Histidine triad (HIT) family protein n=1 Tax=Desulfallas thermosapovorans DSM 6562 TaxID=1121431 RepID=A0A5S4ZWK4_9FIRM|nr:histidine triad nucleotide-binding protein [Desulfallas thermosapovorans]TYO97252.1 histidine triad (HIT) family protein [Desulfallas thermosapovorans DSM 6562]